MNAEKNPDQSTSEQTSHPPGNPEISPQLQTKQKDKWDKFATISTFISSVVIALVALGVTNWISLMNNQKDAEAKERQNKLYEMDLLVKFMPYLGKDADESTKSQAVHYIKELGSPNLARVVAVTEPSPGKTRAITKIAAESENPADQQAAITAQERTEDLRAAFRTAARTSISPKAPETFPNIESLLATLPSDEVMRKHSPPISTNSERVPEEDRNVTVPAYLYAAKREQSNDFSLILGDDPNQMARKYLTAAVSGLPRSGPFRDTLMETRKQFSDSFPGLPLHGINYRIFDPPIPVRVTGSLFYNVSHLPGVTGPFDHRPATAWEIHPITKMIFEH